MTYMYNGTVSVPHNKLNTFLKTAEALKIKGIVETGTSDDSAVSDTSVSPQVSPSHLSSPASLLPAQVILISDWLICTILYSSLIILFSDWLIQHYTHF